MNKPLAPATLDALAMATPLAGHFAERVEERVDERVDENADDLAMRLSLHIAQIYRYSQGNSPAEFKRLCFVALQQLIEFDWGCWVNYDDIPLNCPSDEPWIYHQPQVLNNQNDKNDKNYLRLFDKPLQTLRANVGLLQLNQAISWPGSRAEQKAFYQTAAYQDHAKAIDLAQSLTTLSRDENSTGYQLIGLFRADKKAFYSQQDIEIKTLITPHLITASRLNSIATDGRDWCSSETNGCKLDSDSYSNTNSNSYSYRAVCDSAGNIIAAEDGFYSLLAAELEDWDKTRLPLDLPLDLPLNLEGCLLATPLKLGGLKIEVTGVANSYYLEASKADDRLERLTKAELRVAGLLSKGLRSKAIAAELNVSPRTVEKHQASIYKKLEKNNKNDTVAYLVKNSAMLSKRISRTNG